MKYLPLLFILTLLSCEDPVTISESNFTTINYSFNDASVAPEYHRSYVIDVTPSEITIQVDSYGDILAEDQFPLEASDLSDLVNTINKAQLKSGDNRPNEACDGGWSESLSIEKTEGKIYRGYFDHCGANTIPAKLGDVESVINAMKALVPNLWKMLD